MYLKIFIFYYKINGKWKIFKNKAKNVFYYTKNQKIYLCKHRKNALFQPKKSPHLCIIIRTKVIARAIVLSINSESSPFNFQSIYN
jgi:hypothetical protein